MLRKSPMKKSDKIELYEASALSPISPRLARQSSPSTTSAVRGLPPDMICAFDAFDKLSRSTVLTVRPTSASCGSVERNVTKSLTLMLLLEVPLPAVENGLVSDPLSRCTFSEGFVMGGQLANEETKQESTLKTAFFTDGEGGGAEIRGADTVLTPDVAEDDL